MVLGEAVTTDITQRVEDDDIQSLTEDVHCDYKKHMQQQSVYCSEQETILQQF